MGAKGEGIITCQFKTQKTRHFMDEYGRNFNFGSVYTLAGGRYRWHTAFIIKEVSEMF